MPLKVICENIDGCDISYPAPFCDTCGKRITNETGHYYWRPKASGEDTYSEQCDIYFFCRGNCDNQFWNDRKEHHPCYQTMRGFVVWMGNNMGLKNVFKKNIDGSGY